MQGAKEAEERQKDPALVADSNSDSMVTLLRGDVVSSEASGISN